MGIGVIVSSLIYERLRKIPEVEVGRLLSTAKINYEEKLSLLRTKFFPDTTLIADEFSKKRPAIRKLRTELPSLWKKITEEAFPIVPSPEEVIKYLSQAGCPLSFKDIGVDNEITYGAIMLSRYIRDRITILDIAAELGILEEVAQSFSA